MVPHADATTATVSVPGMPAGSGTKESHGMMATWVGDHRHGLEVMGGRQDRSVTMFGAMSGEGLFALHCMRARRHQVNLCLGKQMMEMSKMIMTGKGEEGPVTHLRLSDVITALQV